MKQSVTFAIEKIIITLILYFLIRITYSLSYALLDVISNRIHTPFISTILVSPHSLTQQTLIDTQKDWNLHSMLVTSEHSHLSVWYYDGRGWPVSFVSEAQLEGNGYSISYQHHNNIHLLNVTAYTESMGEDTVVEVLNVRTPFIRVANYTDIQVEFQFDPSPDDSGEDKCISLLKWKNGGVYELEREYVINGGSDETNLIFEKVLAGLYTIRFKSLPHPSSSSPHHSLLIQSEEISPTNAAHTSVDSNGDEKIISVNWKLKWMNEEFIPTKSTCTAYDTNKCQWSADSNGRYMVFEAPDDTFVHIGGRYNYPQQLEYDIEAVMFMSIIVGMLLLVSLGFRVLFNSESLKKFIIS